MIAEGNIAPDSFLNLMEVRSMSGVPLVADVFVDEFSKRQYVEQLASASIPKPSQIQSVADPGMVYILFEDILLSLSFSGYLFVIYVCCVSFRARS